MLAVGRELKRRKFYECATWFRIRPAHSSREYQAIAEERMTKDRDVTYMAFVSNEHILTQFRNLP